MTDDRIVHRLVKEIGPAQPHREALQRLSMERVDVVHQVEHPAPDGGVRISLDFRDDALNRP